MPKLRQNIVTGDWVVISPERAKRPEDFVPERKQVKAQSKGSCPFCPPNGEAYLSRIASTETDNLYVLPNKYPAFVSDDEIIQEGGDFYTSYKSIGAHEVISFKDHDIEIPDLKEDVLVDLFSTYQKRMAFHDRNPVIEYISIIHNFGSESGASIDHPHSQLFASSIMPPYITKELLGSKKYYQEHKECVFCRMIQEEKQEFRIIEENEKFIAFTFFASRFPFEVWILPKEHMPRFESMGHSSLNSLVQVFSSVMKKMANLLNEPPYNFFIHTSPAQTSHTSFYYHWHLEITPRLSKLGGYEIGTGLIIDVVSPESAAKFLRGEK